METNCQIIMLSENELESMYVHVRIWLQNMQSMYTSTTTELSPNFQKITCIPNEHCVHLWKYIFRTWQRSWRYSTAHLCHKMFTKIYFEIFGVFVYSIVKTCKKYRWSNCFDVTPILFLQLRWLVYPVAFSSFQSGSDICARTNAQKTVVNSEDSLFIC